MKQLVTLFLAILVATCGRQMPAGTRQTAAEAGGVKTRADVRLDLFSGRENPTWRLPEEDVAAVLKVIDELPAAASPGQFFDGLGYRGFLVTLIDAESGTTNELRVYQGKVRHGVGEKAKFLNDSGRRLERLLLRTGKPHLGRADFEYVERQVGAP